MFQHFSERGFVEKSDAELLRFIELATWFCACENVIGFLAHAAGDVSPEGFNFFRRFFPRYRG